MRLLFEGTVAKDPRHAEENEDRYAASPQKRLFALSDGASESFDSKLWATSLVEYFVENPEMRPGWVGAPLKRYNGAYNRESMSWSAQAALDKGSFATLLGVEIGERGSGVDIIAIGDSLAVLVDSERFVRSFPYESATDFKQRPTLLSTLPEHNAFLVQSGFFLAHTVSWQIEGMTSPIVLCMTDALGEWFLRNKDRDRFVPRFLRLARSAGGFPRLIGYLRKQKTMRRDDTTLLVIDLKP